MKIIIDLPLFFLNSADDDDDAPKAKPLNAPSSGTAKQKFPGFAAHPKAAKECAALEKLKKFDGKKKIKVEYNDDNVCRIEAPP